MLTSLAEHNKKTIVCSLHYPSKELLYQSGWHNLVFLSGGRLVYNGTIALLDTYLAECCLRPAESVSSDKSSSAVEFMLEVLGDVDRSMGMVEAWNMGGVDLSHWLTEPAGVFPRVDSKQPISDIFEDHDSDSKSSQQQHHHHLWYEIRIVSLRHFMYKLQALEGGLRTIIGRYVLAGILFGFTFRKEGREMEEQKSVFEFKEANFFDASYNMMSLEFCMCCFLVVSCCLAIPEMYHMREYLDREAVREICV